MVASQVGDCESSKSAMYVSASEFSALITILVSPEGPVISTCLCWRSAGSGEIVQSPSLIHAVSGRKSGILPALISICL